MDNQPVHGEEWFKAHDGLRLFGQWWLPESHARAAVLIVHGYADHSGRYAQIAASLASSGYAVYAFDMRGHGRSEGERAFIGLFDKYFADLENILADVRKRQGQKKIFLLGHSIGGTAAMLFVINYKPDLAGLVLSAPYLKFPSNIWPVRFKLVRMLTPILPRFPVTEKVNGRFISKDPEVIDSYEADPLIYHRPVQAQEAFEIMRALEFAQSGMKNLTLPFIILHGAQDKLVNIEGSRELYGLAGAQDKTLKIYPGLYHELLNDPHNEIVVADLVKWLDSHVNL